MSQATEGTAQSGRVVGIFPKLMLSLISVALMLGTLEGLAFVWERREAAGVYAWELVASRRMEFIEAPAGDPQYTLIKPGSSYEWAGIPVEANSLGLRNPETGYAKPEGVFRILNIGDSIVMGWGVGYEDTYGYRLEALMNEQAQAGLQVEVINAGIPGWNLENELGFLREEGLKYEPDLILLDLTLVNDIFGGNALLKQQRPAWMEWLRVHTYTYPFLSVQMRWLQARADGNDRIDLIDPPTQPESYFPLDPAAPRWAAFLEKLEAIHQLADANQIPLVLMLFPLEFQVLDPDFPTVPQDLIGQFAREMGIPAVDLLPVYLQACLDRPGGSCTLEDRYLFADVWMHPSPLGHGLAAGAVLPFVVDEIR